MFTPLSVEDKTTGDDQSGIMLRKYLYDGPAAIQKKEYSAERGPTTACTMRMLKPWFVSNCMCAGDSWFAGVKIRQQERALPD
ncbi:MAG: hypothetical protein SGPRY_001183 [Prymnesium sp.]